MSDDQNIVIVNNGLGIKIDRETLVSGPQIARDFIGTLLCDSSNKPMSYSHFVDPSTWIYRLGSYFASNANQWENHGRRILRVFHRILDPRTYRLLNRIPTEWKVDTQHITLWMMLNIDEWLATDSTHMSNKRIRRQELLMYGLFERVSIVADRIVNNRRITKRGIMSTLRSFRSNDIMKYLSQVDTLRYCDSVNHSVFPLLSVTRSGSMGSGNKGARIADKHMYLLPSMMGVISPCATSNTEPGVTGTLCPYMQVDANGRILINNQYESMVPDPLGDM